MDHHHSNDSSASQQSIGHPPLFNCDWSQQVEKRSAHNASTIDPGPPALYHLNTERKFIDTTERKIRRWTYGQKDRNKQNKVILMVGETGAGKSTMINTMTNYLLGVKFEDEEFYQITDETEDKQTSVITVYEVFVEENPTSLTIIDTPGYTDTEGYEKDREIAEYMSKLFSDEEGIHYIDAVCFVMKSSQNQLSGKELYMFHSVLSLFGRDIENNIVFLLTHSDGQHPIDALNAINTAEIPFRRDEDNQPVHYLFNNRLKEKRDGQYEHAYRSSWEIGQKSMNEFLMLLDEKNRKSVQMTLDVLNEQSQLEACVSNLKEQILVLLFKTEERTLVQEAIKDHRDKIQEYERLQFTVKRSFKEKVPIENESWRNRNATCCSVCQENCHEKCWWVKDLSWCEAMKNNHCTVCAGKCHYSKHIRENKKYEIKTIEIKMTFEDLRQEYERNGDQPETSFDQKEYENTKKQLEKIMKKFESKMKKEIKLNSDLNEIKKQKSNLLHEVYMTIMSRSKIALQADSAFTLQHLDFLIPRLKEEGKDEWVKNLEDLRKTGEDLRIKGALHLLESAVPSFSHLHRCNSMDLPPEMISDVFRLRNEYFEIYERDYPQLQQCIERLHDLLKTFEEDFKHATEGSRSAGVAGIVGGAAVVAGMALAPLTMGVSVAVAGAGAGIAIVGGVVTLTSAGNKSLICSSKQKHQMSQLRKNIEAEMKEFQNKINPMAEKIEEFHECTGNILKILQKLQIHASDLSDYFAYASKKFNICQTHFAKWTGQMSETMRLITTVAAVYGGFSLVLDIFSIGENSRALQEMDKLAEKPIHEETDESEFKSKAGKFIVEMRKFIHQLQNIFDELKKAKDQIGMCLDTA